MENKRHNLSPDLEDMRILVHEKAKRLLKDLSVENLDYFVKESTILARKVLEKYVFAVYDYYIKGECAIKDLGQREAFTNFRTGYQQKMLNWIEQNKPTIEMVETSTPLQEPSDIKWHYVAFGIGTAGAIGFEIGRRFMEGHRYWIGIVIELLTLASSYIIYKKEHNNHGNCSSNLKQNESELETKKESFVNETVNQLEKWLKEGEVYSNKLLTTFNL